MSDCANFISQILKEGCCQRSVFETTLEEEISMRRIIPGFTIVCLVILFLLNQNNASVQSKEERDLEAVIASTGLFFKENREMLMNGLSISRDIPEERISFYVNGVPVSHDEMMMSLGVALAGGIDRTIEEVKERLTMYAIFYQKAQEFGVYPTEEQVNEYLQWEKSGMEETDEGKAMIRLIMEEWGLTEDEFWNVYQKYHAYNMLTALNVQKELIPWYYKDEIYTPEDGERARLEVEAWFLQQLQDAEIIIVIDY
jgi:hypothetical protein